MTPPLKVLFLCTGNSARSILFEATLNHLGAGRFVAYSAGSHPSGRVHAAALDQLARAGISTAGFHSKSWDEFSAPGAPALDLVVTVCGNADQEPCPVFLGDFLRVHWGLPDPAAVPASAAAEAFRRIHEVVRARVQALTELPLEALDRPGLARALREIDARHPALALPAA